MSAVTATMKLEPLAFWSRFREELENRIKEGNAVSGEPLWKTTTRTGPGMGVTIESVYRPADRLDCAFDPKDCVLSFTSGPALRVDASQFHWVGGPAHVLRKGTEEFTLSQALTLLLDELVWPDE